MRALVIYFCFTIINYSQVIFLSFSVKGGNHGPYTQSERLPLYQQFVEQLIQSGHAYPCFCTERRLEFVKKEAIRDGSIPRYDNRCRQLTLVKVEEKKRQGIPYCIRFKVFVLRFNFVLVQNLTSV